MLFEVERQQLLDAVTNLSRIVSNKTSQPVLEGILISAERGKITLLSYNLEMGMKKEIYANTKVEGDIVLPARFLSDILRRMNGIQVEIESDDRLMCHIRCGEAVFDIMGMDAQVYPEVPFFSEGENVTIEAEIFKDMVRGTLFAVAQNEGTRPILTGINISVENKTLQFVAIDGYRLAIRRQKVSTDKNCEFIIPGKSISEVVKLIGEECEDVEIKITKKLVAFLINGYTFISRVFEGDFVNYKKTIPEEYKQRVFINTKDLINIIERMSIIISDSFSTPVRCLFNEEKISFTCATAVGRAKEEYGISLEGTPFEIGLNSRYLLEALKATEEERVEILFNGSNSGVVINPTEHDDYKYMIMPMRLK